MRRLLTWWHGVRQRRRDALIPERRWRVDIAGDVVTVVDHTGQRGAIALDAVTAIVVETDDSGPWGTDVWWWLYGDGGLPAATWPQGATGEGAVLDVLLALPGFDHEAMVRAMASTEVATFPLWRRARD